MKQKQYEKHCEKCGIMFLSIRTDSRFCCEKHLVIDPNDNDPIYRQANIQNKLSEVIYSLLRLRESPDAKNSLDLLASFSDELLEVLAAGTLSKLRKFNKKISEIMKYNIDQVPTKILRAI